MQRYTFNRKQTNLFTEQQNQLVYQQDELLSFIGHTFSKENFRHQLKEKGTNYTQEIRHLVAEHISQSYVNRSCSDKLRNNITAFSKDTTFTITTGHQLSLFTGPMFTIYKIMHVIRLTEELTKEYPEYTFVPVFWMASEDHDFEEVQATTIFNKTIAWNSEQQGPVGRFLLNDFAALKNEVLSFFTNHPDSEVVALLDAYTGDNYGEATCNIFHALFESYGLVIVDGDNATLKSLFRPVLEKELKEQFSHDAVMKTNTQLEKEGLKLQVTARELNLFYIEDQFRERILHLEDSFFIEGKGKFSVEQMMDELKTHPERFSPNVILRPIYQETILPNLCYVGGVGELSYWLQLKGVFQAVSLTYPLIQARTSMLWIDPATSKKMHKTEIVLEDLFKDIHVVKSHFLHMLAADDLDFETVEGVVKQLKTMLLEKVMQVDSNMESFAQAEMVKLEKQISFIKEKLTKTVKQKHDAVFLSIDQIFERLFPKGGLQERVLNLFSLCPDGNVYPRLKQIHELINPFDSDFCVVRE
jgi:bacillithiol biosynthesis cysteine-adding enzyme BshC